VSDWLASTQDRLNDGRHVLSALATGLGEPQRLQQIQRLLCLLAAVWLAWVMSQVVWLLLPRADVISPPTPIINSISGSGATGRQAQVNIEELTGWDLFGSSRSIPVAVEAEPVASDVPSGIEDGASETRLKLKLQGLVSSPDADMARAIIEYQNKQEQYAVGDKLPVSGTVKLAKVLNDRVVIDNGGKYELLMLFDDSAMSTQPLQPAEPEKVTGNNKREIDRRGSRDVTQMAESYRERLYKDPTSLAQAVRISAQRVDGQLQGYRVSPGKDKEQFNKLGFLPNDIVTGVNGIALTDPGKAMELYRVMRTAQEASFDVLRGGEQITLVVGLGADTEEESETESDSD
jgi:general secretion pathway protein C